MKKYGVLIKSATGRPRMAGPLGRILTALIFCFSIMMALPSVQSAWAAETTQNAAVTARKLQLEGTRLQLQGNLKEAIEKYKESISLQPNPRLEMLIQKLEPQAGRTEQVASAPAVPPTRIDTPAETAAEDTSKASGTTVLPDRGAGKQEEAPLVAKRAPGTPEEELIYAFTDWALNLFPQKEGDKEFFLDTNRNYAITQDGGQYEVRLDPFTLNTGKHDRIELGPIVFNFRPRGRDTLGVTMHLPNNAPLKSLDKTVAELTIGNQEISGVWDRTLLGFEQSDLQLGNLVIRDSGNEGRFDIKEIALGNTCSQDGQGIWDEKYQGHISGISFVDKKSTFNLEKIAVRINLGGSNHARYVELKKNFQGSMGQFDELNLSELKTYLGSLDEYVQIFSHSTTSVTIQGVRLKSEGNTFRLDTIDLSGGVHKDAQTGKYSYDSKMEAQGGSFIEGEKRGKTPGVSASLSSLGFVGKGSMKRFPPNMFADLFSTVEGFTKVKKEEFDAYLAGHGTAFAKKILALIEGYSAEINLNGLNVVNAAPEPITLETAQLRGSFDVGRGEGGTVQTLLNFSGFNGPAQGANNLPQAARFNFEIKNIPSLLDLIADPSAIATGNMQRIQGQVMMQAMNSLMMSALTFSLTDSFVVFPASRLSLGLLAHIDNKAKYFSTGNLQVAIENPDEFMRISRSFGADPDMQKMLVTITALANRSNENGKIVDKIDANVNQEGKLFINSKDVTLMISPETAPTGQGQGAEKNR